MFNSDVITAASSMLIPLALARLAVTSCTSFPLLSVLAFEWTTLVIKFSTSTEKTLSI